MAKRAVKNSDAVSADDENGAAAPKTETPKTEGEEKVLLAKTHILYHSRQYRPGDILPANDGGMVSAWLQSGTAAWVSAEALQNVKAKPMTAIPGLTGTANPPTMREETLVGRVRVPENRGK